MQSLDDEQFKGLRFCEECLNILHPRVNEEAILEFVCKTCDNQYPRKRKANGRFRCRACSTILIDVVNAQEAN